MPDPRNVAHDKKVSHDKKRESNEPAAKTESTEALPVAAQHEASPTLEGSVTVLSQLKEMEFHSRANLERLAELMLTVEDTLKQKEFAAEVGDLFSAQDAFQTKLTALIQGYQAEVTRMQEAAA